MLPEDQPTVPTRPPDPARSTPPGVWAAPSVEEMQAKLPQYEVIEILGRGGMGAVYKARQKSLKRLVAIKILPLGMADDEFRFAERFQNEAQTMAAMNHPAIVSVYDFGETSDGLLYFVMEFVDGTDVQKMIAGSGRLSGEYALSITAHVCDALAYAHARGVIHRDIKPANILIDSEGHIKVADFGLAKMSDPGQTSGLTKTNMAMGTPDYVAPEVLSPGTVADHRADLYAVGVMLYQMLTGEVPRGMFKLPSQKGIGCDPRFDEIICKAMEHDREERFQTAMEVRTALDMILTTPQPKDDGTGIVAAAKMPPETAAAVPKPARRAAGMWMSIGGIAAVLGVAGFFMFGGHEKPGNVKPTAASIGTLDLLPLIDVKRDALAGEWSREGGDLLVKPAKPGPDGMPRLQLPYQPPEEYDFEIEFTPESGENCVYQLLSAYERSFAWVMDVKLTAGNKAGFDRIDGQSMNGRTNGTVMKPKFLTNGQRHRSTVEVRKTGVRALLDGKELVSYGNSPRYYQALDPSPNETLRDTLHLGLAARERAVRFHKITVREITGAGAVDATPAPAAGGVVIDWLKADIWKAPWVREGAVVKATADDAINWIGKIADGTVRVRFRMPETTTRNAPPLQIAVRATQIAGTTKDARYLFQFIPQKGICHLLYLEKGGGAGTEKTEYLWRDKPLLPTSASSNEFEFEIRAERDQLSFWSGGQLIASTTDSRLSSGSCGIIANPGIELMRAETSGVE